MCVRLRVARGIGVLSFPAATAEPSWGICPAGDGGGGGVGAVVVAGNGASLAPATSNPRLACEDNGCLIFSIRRAQCRILSFTRGGASEVISQRHSARALWLCGGAGRPPRRGLAAGRGVQLRPLQRGPAGPAGVGTGAASPGSRPAGSIAGRCAGTRRFSPARPGPARSLCPHRGCSAPAPAAAVAPSPTPTFLGTSSAFFF